MKSDWSRLEVEAVVADYFAMFAKELRNEAYNKSAHRKRLGQLLNARSEGSIEFKHQNISAVLRDLGFPHIPGYKPLSNYQQLLADVVAELVLARPDLEDEVRAVADAPVEISVFSGRMPVLVSAPAPTRATYVRERTSCGQVRMRLNVDYLERESRNRSLGLAGERLVLEFERVRLRRAGLATLAREVEHTSLVASDGAGFDIRSFEVDGSERLIEVKTTAWGEHTPFFLTKNELATSQDEHDRYHLYRLFDFRKSPRMFTVAGAIDQAFALDPTQYLARVS